MKIEAVNKTIWVPLTPPRAFELFAAQLPSWWPQETHSLSAGQNTKPKSMAVDARKGGEITETLADGSTSTWGHFSHYDPPAGLEISWHVGRTPKEATRVAVRFDAEKDGTRLHLTHDGWEALGADGQGTRDGYNGGWVGVLARFEDHAKTG